MRLTNQELRFIDKYLENSDVKYLDIRMELTDHIASAVEDKMQNENLDFHEAFKGYMIVNKKALLKQNSYSIKKFFGIIFKGYYHLTTLIFAFSSIIITQLSLMYFEELKTLFNIILGCYFIFIISLYLLLGKKRLNYSVIAYLGFSMLLVFQVFNFSFGLFRQGLEKQHVSIYGFALIALMLTSFMVFIRLYIVLYEKYKRLNFN